VITQRRKALSLPEEYSHYILIDVAASPAAALNDTLVTGFTKSHIFRPSQRSGQEQFRGHITILFSGV
jgi:hypothetical protein